MKKEKKINKNFYLNELILAAVGTGYDSAGRGERDCFPCVLKGNQIIGKGCTSYCPAGS